MRVYAEPRGDQRAASLVLRAGQVRFAGEEAKANVVRATLGVDAPTVRSLLEPCAVGFAPNLPVAGVFENAHAAWYHRQHMAPHALAASCMQGRRAFTTGPSGQVSPQDVRLPRVVALLSPDML
jgi:hypothetical protein